MLTHEIGFRFSKSQLTEYNDKLAASFHPVSMSWSQWDGRLRSCILKSYAFSHSLPSYNLWNIKLAFWHWAQKSNFCHRKVHVTVLSPCLSSISKVLLSVFFHFLCTPHQPILAKVKTASSLVPPPTILTPSLCLSSTLLRAPKACTWVSLELSFTHNTNFKLQRQPEAQHTPELLALGFSFGFNQPARVFGGKVLKGYKSFFTPSGSRDICHQLPLGARSCESHAGRVSAAWRGGML